MPTYERGARFIREFAGLTAEQQRAALAMVRLFVVGVGDRQFDPRLRVKRVQGYEGVWEAPGGHATFHYGPEQRPGEAHVTWRRIGTHDIFRAP